MTTYSPPLTDRMPPYPPTIDWEVDIAADEAALKKAYRKMAAKCKPNVI
jgi:hypothetical protein